MKFRYHKLELDKPAPEFKGSQRLLWPLIPIDIIYKGEMLPILALLDSGAVTNIFPSEIGEVLGIPLESGPKGEIYGIGSGVAHAYYHDVELRIGGHILTCWIGFSPDYNKKIPPVLGQYDFFSQCSVKFDYAKEEIELRKPGIF